MTPQPKPPSLLELREPEYRRPDVVVLRSIMDASDQIARRLKIIGDERQYYEELNRE